MNPSGRPKSKLFRFGLLLHCIADKLLHNVVVQSHILFIDKDKYIMKPRKHIYEDMLDDFAGIKSHASEIVSKDEYVSPLDDSNYRYLTKIFLMNTSNLITDYIKSKHKVEMILESLSIDASVVELHTKTSIGFIDSSVKMEKLDVSNEPSIVADSTNYLVFGFNPGNMNIKRIKRFYDSLYYIELALVAI